MILRDYQKNIFDRVIQSCSNDLIQLDTGGGKTPIEAALAKDHDYVLAVVHRNLLVAQISDKFSAFGIDHNILGSNNTIKRCALSNRNSKVNLSIENKWVCSVDSIIARHKRGRLDLDFNLPWLIIIDEAHHVVKKNKWGKLQEIFPNARILGFTATPCRNDGQSLSVSNDGIFEKLIQADDLKKESVAQLINCGHLSDFKCYSILSKMDLKVLKKLGGDYTTKSLEKSVENSEIIGDAIKNYKRLANNEQAVVFCISIKNAEETAQKFLQAGYSSACISSKMTQTEIGKIVDLFRINQITILCNVDIIGEGFDVPGIQALIMLRKTASFGKFRQWIGRSLRPEDEKNFAKIIDHVGNIVVHGLPDLHIDWDIEKIDIPKHKNLINCEDCGFVFKAYLKHCPECGQENKLAERKSIGGYYVEQDVIDFKLCEIERRKIDEAEQKIIDDKRAEEERILFETQLLPITNLFKQDAIGSVCQKLAEWFIENIKDTIKIKDLNLFIKSFEIGSQKFWIDNFTVMDLKNLNQKKCLEVFKKWQITK